MGEITNIYYRAFLDGGIFEEINRDDIIKVLDNISIKQNPETCNQARAMVIVLWASGARPNEVLRLKGLDFNKTKEFLEIKMPASKGSNKRHVALPCFLDKEMQIQDPLVIEVNDYIKKYILPDMFAFWAFRSKSLRPGVTKSYKLKSGEIKKKIYTKVYEDISCRLRYYFPKWFDVIFPDGIPPYYLRHSRATKTVDMVGREAARELLGHKSEITTNRYVHMTKKVRKQVGDSLMK